MNPYVPFEALETKITAKKSQLLDKEKFRALLNCDSIDQMAEMLKSEYDFHNIFDRADKQIFHRDVLETLFHQHAVSELENILHFFSGPYREFMKTFLMEFEIYDLLLIFRKISMGESAEDMQSHFIHPQKHSPLQYDDLMELKTIAQLVEKLKGTSYFNVLKTAADSDPASREFHVETKLQLLFYTTLFRKARKLSPDDSHIAEDLIGLKVDCLNVQWIFRAQKYYHFSPEQMLVYSLPGGRMLGLKKLKTLCYAKSADETRMLINRYLNSTIFTDNDEMNMERNLDDYLYREVTSRQHRKSVGMAISYVYLLEIVMKEFIVATEAIRYRVPKELIGSYLIRSMDKKGVNQ